MQFRTGVAKAFGITFAAPNPVKDETRIRAVIESELKGQLASEVKVTRRELPQPGDTRPWYAVLLDPQIQASFMWEVEVPLVGRSMKVALAVSDNGHIGTVIGMTVGFDVRGSLPGAIALDSSGRWAGSQDSCDLINEQPAVTKALRRQLRDAYSIGNMTVHGVIPRLTLFPSGDVMLGRLDTLPDATWGGRPRLCLDEVVAAVALLEQALKRV